jgi:hypothetical protein
MILQLRRRNSGSILAGRDGGQLHHVGNGVTAGAGLRQRVAGAPHMHVPDDAVQPVSAAAKSGLMANRSRRLAGG